LYCRCALLIFYAQASIIFTYLLINWINLVLFCFWKKKKILKNFKNIKKLKIDSVANSSTKDMKIWKIGYKIIRLNMHLKWQAKILPTDSNKYLFLK
jgi:hypothetical protein